jgi:hypothetical protein
VARKIKPPEPPGITLNGFRLDNLKMQYMGQPYPGNISFLGTHSSNITLQRDETGFTLTLPTVSAVQLFAAGIVGPLPEAYVDLGDGNEVYRGLNLVWVRCRKRPDGRDDIALRLEHPTLATARTDNAPALQPRSTRGPEGSL